MAVYFASDMHLRLDRPERGDRLARWIDGLDADDAVYLLGDICDFWLAARQLREAERECPGLRALARFRARGGALTIVPGNHDGSLGSFYERVLGARVVPEPLEIAVQGLRVHAVHGHRAGGRQPWKAGMESRAFLKAFGLLPEALAGRLSRLLDRSNDRGRILDEERLIAHYRHYLAGLEGQADLAVFGHVHSPLDDPSCHPRLIVLGGWHRGTRYLRIDDQGATLRVVPDPDPSAVPA